MDLSWSSPSAQASDLKWNHTTSLQRPGSVEFPNLHYFIRLSLSLSDSLLLTHLLTLALFLPLPPPPSLSLSLLLPGTLDNTVFLHLQYEIFLYLLMLCSYIV